MYGITINGKHTYRDLGMVVGNTDIVGIPKPKQYLVEIPYSSVVLDFSEAVTGKIEYGNRILKVVLGKLHPIDNWSSEISNFLQEIHGQKVEVVLDDDVFFYYEGRCEVKQFSRTRNLGVIELSIESSPYKWERTSSNEDWIWDSFDFEQGVIREYKDLVVMGSLSLEVVGSFVDMTPIFYCHHIHSSTVRFYSKAFNQYFDLREGKNLFPEFMIKEKGDTLTFYGNCNISIDVKGGRL